MIMLLILAKININNQWLNIILAKFLLEIAAVNDGVADALAPFSVAQFG